MNGSTLQESGALMGRKATTPWKIGVGILVLLVGAVNSTSAPPAPNASAALGQLIGLATVVAIGAALVAAGLPKTLGTLPAFRKLRRRIWYRLMVLGFLAMVLLSSPS
jgi:hypothetical protein